ncbi:putative immunity protein [Sphingobacterium multivorum]|uniref:Imm-5-like domain-containing protein n=1 Tax=Sphingobacterium multivorum TaxID=28454 RepID=A0ABX7CUY1_SPHMU|nr:hypothetical protein [Sphingobacterium multivorum]QQT33174.1 hypothetical protein I6I99_11625 [Sphingobacterium multivorum]QQT55890.1 hypothetical protein I6I98_11780 [Sphingobacterium multivorum]
MRHKSFIASHRGGDLSVDDHKRLMNWAIACAMRALNLMQNRPVNNTLIYALDIAKEWEKGNVKTGAAMKAAYAVHAVARDVTDPLLKSISRSIGQAVSTAHMADHCLGAALYALKAAKLAGSSLEEEFAWQDEKLKDLLPEMTGLIQATRDQKKRAFKDLRD